MKRPLEYNPNPIYGKRAAALPVRFFLNLIEKIFLKCVVIRCAATDHVLHDEVLFMKRYISKIFLRQRNETK